MHRIHERGTVEDYLGPAAKRFFGNGYKRIGEVLRNLTVDLGEDGAGSVAGTAAVVYPADWSVKSRGGIPPHLSTIDAVAFTAQLAELYLSAAFRLDAGARSRMWLRRVDIRAGSAPTETGLDALPVSARLISTAAAAGSPLGHVSVLECRVSRMTVRCEVEHPVQGSGPVRLDLATPEELLEPIASRPYGDGYRTLRTEIGALSVDLAEPAAEALFTVTPEDPAQAPVLGMEGAYQPSMTLIDLFVAALQLGQILLYETDGVPRAESQTLWMRRTVFEAAGPHRDATRPTALRTRLEDSMLVEAGDEVWRSADIVADALGARVRCFASHRLPAEAARRVLSAAV